MTSSEPPSRRAILWCGVLLNAVAGLFLMIPIFRYLSSPVTRKKDPGYDAWLNLGALEQFPEGETRLATYRNPLVNPSDGDTAKVACWVRRVEGDTFQVFAINCAHLGCPVRWFPQSRLFMCPCHGGAYYMDGARASGPPERGLFEYPYKIDHGQLFIKTGQMPTPGGLATLNVRKSSCA